MTMLRLLAPPVRVGTNDPFLFGVRDIGVLSGAFGSVLYTVTAASGAGLAVWQLTAQGLGARFDTGVLPGGDFAGQTPDITLLSPGGGTQLALTGVNGAGLWSFDIGTDGALSAQGTVPADHVLPADLAVVAEQQVFGRSFLYGARQGAAEIDVWLMGAQGLGTHLLLDAETSTGHLGFVALAAAGTEDSPLLVAASQGPDALQVYQLGQTGQGVLAGRVRLADGLGIDTPSAVQVVAFSDWVYVVLAASGSSSLSVFSMGDDGSLQAVDHVMDGRDTRFADVTHLETAWLAGVPYLVAAGSDDGVSLFRLLPDGRLLHQVTLENASGQVLGQVAAVQITALDGVLHLAVASAGDGGVTMLQLVPQTEGLGLFAQRRATDVL